jgi:hypothetical protein
MVFGWPGQLARVPILAGLCKLPVSHLQDWRAPLLSPSPEDGILRLTGPDSRPASPAQETTTRDGAHACRRHERVTQITGTKCKLGLSDVQRQGGAVQAFTEQVPAQERGDAAGAGDDLDGGGQDLVLEHGQHLRGRPGGLPGLPGGVLARPAPLRYGVPSCGVPTLLPGSLPSGCPRCRRRPRGRGRGSGRTARTR